MLVALAARPALGQDTPAARRAAGLVSKALLGHDPARALQPLTELATHDAPVAVDAVLDVFEHGSPALFPSARRVLAAFNRAASMDRLLDKGLGHSHDGVRAQVLLALGDIRPSDADWIPSASESLTDRDPGVRAAAVTVLGRARAGDAAEAILELAADPSARVRQQVPGALVRLRGPRALPAIQSMAHDPHWRVRLAVIEALTDLAGHHAIEQLLAMLADEQGRLREDAAAGLGRLTGLDLGLDAAVWARALRQASPALTLESSPSRYAGAIRYHHVPSASRRFVLATDLSGSMASPLAVLSRYEEHPVPRIVLARNELEHLLGTLDELVFFNLVTFRHNVRSWKQRLVAASPRILAAASREVRSYEAAGGTNVFGVLEQTFDLAQASLDEPAGRTPEPDTLFLLTDGVPNSGELRDPRLLLDYVAERNRLLKLRIHCISLAGGLQEGSFLQQLARLTGGAFTALPVPGGS